jgi:hypothetical protein
MKKKRSVSKGIEPLRRRQLELVKNKTSGLDARIKLFNKGARPVPPLSDGFDIWADEKNTYSYRATGEIVWRMSYDEYKIQRATIDKRLYKEIDTLLNPLPGIKSGAWTNGKVKSNRKKSQGHGARVDGGIGKTVRRRSAGRS